MPTWRTDWTTIMATAILCVLVFAGVLSVFPPHFLHPYRTNFKPTVTERVESVQFLVFFNPKDDCLACKVNVLRVAYHSIYLQELGVEVFGVATGRDPRSGLQPLPPGTSVAEEGWDLPFPVVSDESGQLQDYYRVYQYEDVWVVVTFGNRVFHRVALSEIDEKEAVADGIISTMLLLRESMSIAHLR